VAVASFVLSLLGVFLVSIPLALIGIFRPRATGRRGRAFATTALAVSTAWALAITAAVAVLTAPRPADVLLAAAPSASPTPTPSPDAGPSTDSITVNIADLGPGDCIAAERGPSILTVQQIPCSLPHDEEVIGLPDLHAGPWPGEKPLERRAVQACEPIFRRYVGVPLDRSRLGINAYVPIKAGWEDGDHTVICVAYDPAGQMTGTVRGSRR
jgi:hypothetical protein